jgi:CheY-like chemotaxis protein
LGLCRRLWAAPRLADLPVALFTQADRPEDVAAGLEVGADFVVWKDLLARPEAWHERLGEILGHSHGRPAELSLSSLKTAALSLSPGEVVGAFNQALRQSPVQQLGPVVVRALARRALARARKAGVALPPPETETGLDERLMTAGPGLNPDWLVATWRREAVVVLVAALAEQVWYVLGPAATASFRTALAGSLPQLGGFLCP